MKKVLTIAALFTALTGTAFAAGSATYDLNIEKPAAKVNVKAVAAVKITAKGEYHINKEYPTKLTLTAPDGVKLDRNKLTLQDAMLTEKVLKFEIGLTASTAGTKTITGQLKGAVCTDENCVPFIEKVSIEVGVAAQ